MDERFREPHFRQTQNYVGESVSWREKIHFVAPKPSDLGALMDDDEVAQMQQAIKDSHLVE